MRPALSILLSRFGEGRPWRNPAILAALVGVTVGLEIGSNLRGIDPHSGVYPLLVGIGFVAGLLIPVCGVSTRSVIAALVGGGAIISLFWSVAEPLQGFSMNVIENSLLYLGMGIPTIGVVTGLGMLPGIGIGSWIDSRR